MSLIFMALFAGVGAARMISGGDYIDQDLRVDDIFPLACLPLYVFLFIVAIHGSSGISIVQEQEDGTDLIVETNESNVSGYTTASPISKAMWRWMNPLLSKGTFIMVDALQLGVSLVLLYAYTGGAMLVSVFAIVSVIVLAIRIAWKNNEYQFNLMMNRDSRIKTTNELVNNMRVIKFQAWEHFIVIAALTFVVAIAMHIPLEAGTVFTITTILEILQEPIRTFPQNLVPISQAMISLERLDGYLTSYKLDTKTVEREQGCGDELAVEILDGTFSWEDEGKSSLLAAALGELHKSSENVRVCGNTAYVSQTSWIQNETIQENILFGSKMDKKRYSDVLRACSLEKDLEIFEHGDQTEIGERGKSNVNVALQECVRGALKGKTILLVTHQVDFLHNADLIMVRGTVEVLRLGLQGAFTYDLYYYVTSYNVSSLSEPFLDLSKLIIATISLINLVSQVMRDGKIVQSGKYEELIESRMDFGSLVAAHETSVGIVEMITNQYEQQPNSPHPITPKSPQNPPGKSDANGENRSFSELSNADNGNPKLIEDEEREIGQVSIGVCKQYCTIAYGWWGIGAVLSSSLIWQLSLMASDYWLEYETSTARTFNASLFIQVFAIIAVISCILGGLRMFLQTLLVSKHLSFFDQMLESVLHSPMSFFDTTPSGRILTRASNDQFNIDVLIPLFLGLTLAIICWLVSFIWLATECCAITIYMSYLVENRMVSVERIKQFTVIPSEAPWRNPNFLLSSDWPNHGDIVVSNLQVRYRWNTPLVLKGISLSIHGGEKIGVVGWTGSGKSTLIQVFFRLVEPSAGKIVIDGVDFSNLGLHDLRSRLGIIP
ncbi:OLC1v1019889C1 [Oldenlandia corymbosa var. corymbosa]|uniref:OLC1v1019889C1 n=1 Tax=Oldenlandia corymbosa var. corymbosa TaxID=529605 RepID=A0AAV1EFB6_OLDCO|nr:OLC1v1019889C1 [Oldenlandia corymbosa var. corymbosa]